MHSCYLLFGLVHSLVLSFYLLRFPDAISLDNLFALKYVFYFSFNYLMHFLDHHSIPTLPISAVSFGGLLLQQGFIY